MKTCDQAAHTAIKANRAAFDALPYRGEMPDETDDGQPARLVLRNCHCGSTLAVQEPVTPAWLEALRACGAMS